MSASDQSPKGDSAGYYTPGHAKAKLLMVFVGFFLVLAGSAEIAQPLRLVLLGARAEAEATTVIKTKKGLPDRVLRTDTEIQNNSESHDRSYVFWNEFRFRTNEGRSVEIRATVGSQLQPLYPLFDSDGLPTTDRVYYDPRHPQTVVLPFLLSTWFAPGVLLFVGLAAMIIGSTLYYWAGKPIRLPHV